MFVPAPIDKHFVPHTRRAVCPSNAGLFVDGAGRRSSGAPSVTPQAVGAGQCAGKPDGTTCGPFPGMKCVDGVCVFV
jgi:hypothetical protein